jgi:uncharacterized protein
MTAKAETTPPGPSPPTRLGTGIGLRACHFDEILARGARVDWFEVLSENFMTPGGRPLHVLERVRRDYPIALHGVSLSIGGTDTLNLEYLAHLRSLASRFEPAWISDHLCWTGVDAHNLHDLLPLPYTEEALAHVVARVTEVQERLGSRIALENVSTYLTFTHSTMDEGEFLATVAERADCDVLLDVNNAYVSGRNHAFDPRTLIDAIPQDRVVQIHLAGHSDCGTHLLDTHDHPVAAPVWQLFRHAIERLGPVSASIEWDGAIPPLARLEEEAARARAIAAEVHPSPAGRPVPARADLARSAEPA